MSAPSPGFSTIIAEANESSEGEESSQVFGTEEFSHELQRLQKESQAIQATVDNVCGKIDQYSAVETPYRTDDVKTAFSSLSGISSIVNGQSSSKKSPQIPSSPHVKSLNSAAPPSPFIPKSVLKESGAKISPHGHSQSASPKESPAQATVINASFKQNDSKKVASGGSSFASPVSEPRSSMYKSEGAKEDPLMTPSSRKSKASVFNDSPAPSKSRISPPSIGGVNTGDNQPKFVNSSQLSTSFAELCSDYESEGDELIRRLKEENSQLKQRLERERLYRINSEKQIRRKVEKLSEDFSSRTCQVLRQQQDQIEELTKKVDSLLWISKQQLSFQAPAPKDTSELAVLGCDELCAQIHLLFHEESKKLSELMPKEFGEYISETKSLLNEEISKMEQKIQNNDQKMLEMDERVKLSHVSSETQDLLGKVISRIDGIEDQMRKDHFVIMSGRQIPMDKH